MSNLDRAKELLEQIIRYKKFPKLNPFISLLIEKATKIKEKVEKGCGEMMYDPREGVFCDDSGICDECEETLKILTEILE